MIHVSGRVDPIDDIEVINLELILADLQMVENIAQKLEKQIKAKKELQAVYDTLQKAIAHLNQNKSLRTMPATPEGWVRCRWLSHEPGVSPPHYEDPDTDSRI